MQTDETLVGRALIKRLTWLGVKLAFFVLAPICLLCWLGFSGLIVYKSISLGVSPLEITRAIDATPSNPVSPVYFSKTIDVFVASGLLVVIGVAFSAVVAAAIGAVAASVRKLRRPKALSMK